MKKRFLDRKAQEDIIGEQGYSIWEVFAFFAVLGVLLGFVNSLASMTIFEKNFLARDMAMSVNTVYAAPYVLVYNYPENTSEFLVDFKNNKVEIFDLEVTGDVAKIYPYADEQDHRLILEHDLRGIDTIKILKNREVEISD